MKQYVFGVDIGGTTIKIGLFRDDGRILEKWEIKTDTSNHCANLLSDIVTAIDNRLHTRGLTKEDVVGIGVGVPGPVDKDGFLHKCGNLDWSGINVAEEMQKITGVKVCAANDANVAALGEAWKGSGCRYNSIIMVTLGTGIGGGIVENGKILAGVHGSAGEIGHTTVRPEETIRCGCGKCGHLEQYASATGLVRMAKKKLGDTDIPSALRDIDPLTAKDIVEQAKSGDGLAMILLDELAEVLGRALANAVMVTDPDAIIIGGGVSKAGKILRDAVEKYYKEYAFFGCEDTKIELAALGNDAGIFGGVKMVLEG